MASNYPIDMEAAKNTKLFKKFMENKNKSIVVASPKIENIQISKKPQSYISQSSWVKEKEINKQKNRNNFQAINQHQQVDRFRATLKNEQLRKNYTVQANFPSKWNKNLAQENSIMENYSSQRKQQNRSIEKILPKDEGSLMKKYDKLLEQHYELKQRLTNEKKQSKKQLIKMQQQIDMFQKKVFQLRNKQDQLILQNKRLKEKSLSESKEKQQIQQANRQLSYQVQQLKDMLDGKDNFNKKRQEETQYWKKINDDLKQKIKQLQLQVVRLKDINNMMERQKFVSQKEVSNKQQHLNDMRQKINSLITQNGVLRDEMFHITSKLYHFEQENKSLKADLKRHSDDFPMAYFQQQLQSASQYVKQQPVYSDRIQGSGQKPRMEQIDHIEKKTERRRGQFARERGIKRAQNQPQNSQLRTSVQQNYMNQRQKEFPNQSMVSNQSKDMGQAIRKLEQLNEELQKLKDMKTMNGGMRRQKINLQREIQQLQQFLKGKQ